MLAATKLSLLTTLALLVLMQTTDASVIVRRLPSTLVPFFHRGGTNKRTLMNNWHNSNVYAQNHKRSLDLLDGQGFGLRKRSYELLDKRALDVLNSADVPGLRKRALDLLDGEDFGLRKRSLDLLDGQDFGLKKRSLDSLDGQDFGLRKRSLDLLDGQDFGLRKRAHVNSSPPMTEAEYQQLESLYYEIIAEALQRGMHYSP